MNIALLGYGKMGKAIGKIATERNHTVTHRITSANISDINDFNKKNIDVVIEFSTPDSGYNNIKLCLEKKLNVVSGTTGDWLKKKDSLDEICLQNSTSFIHSSNFSIGMNIFFELNKKLAFIMKNKSYNVHIEETHHIEKKDSPSGTAIVLQKDIAKIHNYEKEISIISHRIINNPGTHLVSYDSFIDNITIQHTAKSREAFSYGAILSAEYIVDKQGIFTIQDVLLDI